MTSGVVQYLPSRELGAGVFPAPLLLSPMHMGRSEIR